MKILDLYYFPKYKTEFINDGYSTWKASVRANGFKSAVTCSAFGERLWISDEEYTWFLLRWS
jgi:hypothetical protein